MATKRGKPVAQLAPVPAERPDDWRDALRTQDRMTGDRMASATAPDEWDALRG